MLLAALAAGCAEQAATIAAMAAHADGLWAGGGGGGGRALAAAAGFAVKEGDHLTLLNVYRTFEVAGRSPAWCAQHGLVVAAAEAATFTHAPLSLLPTPFPRAAFEQAQQLAAPFALLCAAVARDAALARAKALDQGAHQGLLHGLPIGVKDLIDTVDMPTSYGSPVYADHRPASDATCVALARAAGAVVHHCGSGVSAIPNILAMRIAGLAPGALFAGSWSEWCSDSARPVARG
jgi:hypothetical protein